MMGDMAFLPRTPSPARPRARRSSRVSRIMLASCSGWVAICAANPVHAQPEQTGPVSSQAETGDASEEVQSPPETTPTSPAPPPYPVAPDAAEPVAPQAYEDSASNPPAEAPIAEPPATPQSAIYEPPLPSLYLERQQQGDVPPPPVPLHLSPRTSLWLGVRPGVLFPLGAMWTDQTSVCCGFSERSFSEFASAGPSLEINAGARLGRIYQLFAFYEHAWLGSGTLDDEFGGQLGAVTSAYGAGGRLTINPHTWGMIFELHLAYRTFETEWENGTRLTASDDLVSTRLGFGVEWRLNRTTTLELLALVGSGILSDVTWTFADGSKADALGAFDTYGHYAPVALQLGVHWDVFGSQD